MMDIKRYKSTLITLHFILPGGAEFARAKFLGGRFAEGQFGKGPIHPAPIITHAL